MMLSSSRYSRGKKSEDERAMDGNGWGNEAKGRPKSPRNGANGDKGGVPPECHQERRETSPLSYILLKSFSNSQPFRGDSFATEEYFQISYPSFFASEPSNCQRHAVTDYSHLREIRAVVCVTTDVVLCYSTSISSPRPSYHGLPFCFCLFLPPVFAVSFCSLPRFFLIFHTNPVMDLWIDGYECLFCYPSPEQTASSLSWLTLSPHDNFESVFY